MAVARVEWQCPQCQRRYAIPADLPRPELCPKCQTAAEEPAPLESKPAQDAVARERSLAPPTKPTDTSAGDVEIEPHDDGGFNPVRFRRKYPALRIISLFYRVMAGLIVLASVAGFVAGVVAVFQADDEAGRMSAVIMGLSSLFGGAFWSVTVLAFAELIQLGLDIEQNTRPR